MKTNQNTPDPQRKETSPGQPEKSDPFRRDKDNDPTRPVPGKNDPSKNDPTRITPDQPQRNDPTRVDPTRIE